QLALWLGYWAFGFALGDVLQMDRSRAALERSLVIARRAGLARQELTSLRFLSEALLMGPTPIRELIDWLRGLEARGLRQSWLQHARAETLAMAGRFGEARTMLADLRAELTQRGATIAYTSTLGFSIDVELLAGDYEAAATFARESSCILEKHGLQALLST